MLLQILAFGINKSPKKLSRKLEPYPGRKNFNHWLVFSFFFFPPSSKSLFGECKCARLLTQAFLCIWWLELSGSKWVTIHFWNGNKVGLSLRALGPWPRQDTAEPGVINFSADLRAVLGHWSHVTQNWDGVTADKLHGDRLRPWKKKSLEVGSKKKKKWADGLVIGLLVPLTLDSFWTL